jgi:glutamate-ammonia-ligase adenylyltransferase
MLEPLFRCNLACAGCGKIDYPEPVLNRRLSVEACLEAALQRAHRAVAERHGLARHADGRPMDLVVLGMGKLGGRELNFSSDIDLIYAYAGEGTTDGPRPVSHGEFFRRVGQRVAKLLAEPTAEGFVHRVDLRLRPFGEAGALAVSFDAMETYYQRHGRDWERYALIKAQPVAGDREGGAELLERLRPFVYRRYLDYGAIDALRRMKALVDAEVRRKGLEADIKRGPGGIREVEFIVQTFQLIHGGRDRFLRRRGLLDVLPRLAARGLLPEEEVERLLAAYAFLRHAENRLQAMEDRQTQRLPDDETGRARLAYAMGFEDWAAFEARLVGHRQAVEAVFAGLLAAPEQAAPADLGALWAGSLDAARAQDRLRRMGFRRPERVLETLRALREGRAYRLSSEWGRQRVDRFVPLWLEAVARSADPDLAFARLTPLVEAVQRRTVYLSLLAENPQALEQLVRLASGSLWVAEYMAQHPMLLDELLDPRQLYAPRDREGLQVELEEWVGQVDPDDLEALMDGLRHFRHAAVLRVAAADLMGRLDVATVSRLLTEIAEVVLEKALRVAWRELTARYGAPAWEDESGRRREAGFAAIGYGKLGGCELGYGSDLDLVFLHDSRGRRQQTAGPKVVDNAVFFSRLGQRVIHILTAQTPAGVLYEVDARLRPSGRSGLLVSSTTAFAAYQREKAWTWEHQALIRARPVAGDERVGEAFRRIRREVLARPRDRDALRGEVAAMRRRMLEEHASPDPGRFHLKRDAGGVVDIEFMVQYLVLAHAHEAPVLLGETATVALLRRLADQGILAGETASRIETVYLAFRARIHAASLQRQEAAVPAQEFAAERAFVRALWSELMEG